MTATRAADIHTDALIKGGMPILIDAIFTRAGDLETIDLRWSNTGKPVSRKFDLSINDDDWDMISTAAWAAYNDR